MVADTSISSSAAGTGHRQVVLAQGPEGQLADHRPGLHSEQERPEHLRQIAEQLRHGIECRPLPAPVPPLGRAVRPGRAHPGRPVRRRRARSLRAGRRLRPVLPGPPGAGGSDSVTVAGQPLEQRLPVVEGAQRPLPRRDHPGREQAAGRDGQAGSLADVQLGHPQQLLDPDPGDRIGVAFRLAAGRGPLGHLPGDLPVDRALAGQQAGQVAHQILERPAAPRGIPPPNGPIELTGRPRSWRDGLRRSHWGIVERCGPLSSPGWPDRSVSGCRPAWRPAATWTGWSGSTSSRPDRRIRSWTCGSSIWPSRRGPMTTWSPPSTTPTR